MLIIQAAINTVATTAMNTQALTLRDQIKEVVYLWTILNYKYAPNNFVMIYRIYEIILPKNYC